MLARRSGAFQRKRARPARPQGQRASLPRRIGAIWPAAGRRTVRRDRREGTAPKPSSPLLAHPYGGNTFTDRYHAYQKGSSAEHQQGERTYASQVCTSTVCRARTRRQAASTPKGSGQAVAARRRRTCATAHRATTRSCRLGESRAIVIELRPAAPRTSRRAGVRVGGGCHRRTLPASRDRARASRPLVHSTAGTSPHRTCIGEIKGWPKAVGGTAITPRGAGR